MSRIIPNNRNLGCAESALTILDGLLTCLALGGQGGGVTGVKGSKITEQQQKALASRFNSSLLDLFFTHDGPITGDTVVLKHPRCLPVPGTPLKRKSPKWKLIGESASQALFLARASLEVLYDHDPRIINFPVESQLSLFFCARHWSEASFIKNAKYHTVWPMARFLQNPEPERPPEFSGHPLVYTGALRRYLKNRLVAFTKPNCRLFLSFLQGVKRGCMVVPPSYILNSLSGHLEKMFAQDPMGEYDDSEEYVEEFIHDVQESLPVPRPRLSDEAWKAYKKTLSPLQRLKLRYENKPFVPPEPRLMEASPSASYQNPYGSGGGREHIRQTEYFETRKTSGAAYSSYDGPNALIVGIDHTLYDENDPDPNSILLDVAAYQKVLDSYNEALIMINEPPIEVDLSPYHRKWLAEVVRGSSGSHFGGHPEPDTFIYSNISPKSHELMSDIIKRRVDGTKGQTTLKGVMIPSLGSMLELRPGEITTVKSTVSPPNIKEAVAHALLTNLPNTEMYPPEKHPDHSVMFSSTVCPVLEPLKVRIITKGDAYGQWVGRFFQKGLWSHLQKYEVFKLTGRPMDGSDLEGILIRERELVRFAGRFLDPRLFEGEEPLFFGSDSSQVEWVSGDFASATDCMSIQATKIVLEVFLSQTIDNPDYDEDLRECLRSVLYEQFIRYPNITDPKDGKSISFVEYFLRENGHKYTEEQKEEIRQGFSQRNAQLMGSILSFPILCWVNMICYKRALEKYLGLRRSGIPIRLLPVLINGDDILFRCDDQLYSLWEEEIARVGFKLSIGKNYRHRYVLMINSQMFWYHKTLKKGSSSVSHFEEIQYFNVGLLTGQSKITGREEQRDMPINDVWNTVIEGAMQPTRALNRFIHYNKEAIDKFTRHGDYNLFIPRWRGGLGFVPPKGYKFRITSFQQRVATLCRLKRLECISKGELPHGIALGIVRESEEDVLKRFHYYKLQETRFYGPLVNGLQDPVDVSIRLPPLSDGYDPERKMKVRHVRNLGAIRSGKIERMSYRKILEEEPRLIEVFSTLD